MKTKEQADEWLDNYIYLRQNGWKRYSDGTWSHPDSGDFRYNLLEALDILNGKKERERNAR